MTDIAVMLSIKPKYCELIASGKKTIEVRKTKPKLETPFKCYIYCTKESYKGKYLHTSNQHGKLLFWHNPNDTTITVQPEEYDYTAYACGGKVIGEFVCKHITDIQVLNKGLFTGGYPNGNCTLVVQNSALTPKDIKEYANGKEWVYGWQISDLKIYDKPKTLEDFRKPCISPEMPYCPLCKVGYEYISETEAEFYRVDGECYTEWRCLNLIRKPPQSWCYVQEVSNND